MTNLQGFDLLNAGGGGEWGKNDCFQKKMDILMTSYIFSN